MALDNLRQGIGAAPDSVNGGAPPALPPRSSQHLEPPPLPRGPVHHSNGIHENGSTVNSHPMVSRKYSPGSQNGDSGAPPPLPPPRGAPLPPPTPPRGTTPPPAVTQQYNGESLKKCVNILFKVPFHFVHYQAYN